MLSFGYWTTNFAEVQRGLSARNLSAAQRTPLIGAFPKLFIPALTIIPGLVAVAVINGLGGSGQMQCNNAIPLLMNRYLPNGMLGIALTGLIASFMAGVAANVSAFNTVVTNDLWQAYVRILGLFFMSADELRKSVGVNINLWLGLAMLALGVLFVLWGWLLPVIRPGEQRDAPSAATERRTRDR